MKPITKPGIYDMTLEEYHADPALSSSGARAIMPPSCPARFRWDKDHPEEPNRVFDIGKVAHRLVLGRGDQVVVIPHKDYRKAEPREMRDAAYAAGKVPVLTAEFDACQEMAAALERHRFPGKDFGAGKLFQAGTPERSIFWRDQETGIMCRARPDFLPANGPIYGDYKTCVSAALGDLTRAMINFGYYQQMAWYSDGIRALDIHDDPQPLFTFQEKAAPYLIVVAQPEPDALVWGDIQNAKARAVFAECVRTGTWPGYADDVVTLEMPGFAASQLQKRHDLGEFDTAYKAQAPLDGADHQQEE